MNTIRRNAIISIIAILLFISLPISGHLFASNKVVDELNSVDGYYPIALSFSSDSTETSWYFIMVPLKAAFPATLGITELSNGEIEVSAKHPMNTAEFKQMPIQYFFSLFIIFCIPYSVISAMYKIVNSKT